MEPPGAGGDAHAWQAAAMAWDSDAMLGASMAWIEGSDLDFLLPLAPAPLVAVHTAPLAETAAPKARATGAAPRRRGGSEAKCQADGCLEVLRAEDTPRYRLRYRLCALHLRAEVVLLAGAPSRFCQKCSRFHPLSEFTGTRRNCSASLAKLRKPAVSPPASGEAESSRQPSPPSQTRDPPSPTAPSNAAREAADLDAPAPFTLESILAPLLRFGSGPDAAQSAAPYDAVSPERSAVTLATADACALAGLHSMQLKLPFATPSELPDIFSAQLQAAWLQGAHAAGGLAAIEAYARPGCTLLHVDALLLPRAPPPASALLTAAALAADAEVGPFFADGGTGAGATLAAAGRCAQVGGDGGDRAMRPGPPLPPLRPAALLASAGGALRFAAPPGNKLPAAAVLRARLAGRMLNAPGGSGADASVFPAPRGRGAADAITLPPLPPGIEGALLVDAFASAAADFPLTAAPRAALVCADAGIVAEVCASADAADTAAAAGDRGAAAAALEAILPALGRALRPGCEAALLRGVAAEALRQGWTATAARLLPALAAASAEEEAVYGEAPPSAPTGAATLMHVAAAHGSAADVAAVLRCGAASGAPDSAGPHAITPLHLAALRRDAHAAAVLAVLRAKPRAASAAWASVRDAWGFTPADVAARDPPPPLPTEREFIAWLVRTNRSSVISVGVLQVLHWQTWVGIRHVLSPATAARDVATALRDMNIVPRLTLRTSTLYNISTGERVALESLPWDAVVAGTRIMVLYALALRIPANLALLLPTVAASPSRPRMLRWYQRHYELLYSLSNIIEMLHMPLVEYLACYRALGLAVDYTPIIGGTYALATVLLSPGFGRSGTFGPCRAAANYIVLLVRLLSFAGALTWQRSTWHAALRSPQIITQMVLCILSLRSVAPNDARLRRLCAADLAAAKAAASKRVD